MKHRIDLQNKLEEILGSRNVYFQPPTGFKLKYPCIIYEYSRLNKTNADNKVYLKNDQYLITIIDKNPESEIIDKVAELPMCSFDRHFINEGLYHTTFSIYY